MKIIVPLVTVLAVSTGSLAGVAAYQRSAGPGTAQIGVPVAQQEPAARVVPGATFRWAPCAPPAVLRAGVCVTEVTRTVTLPAPAAPAAPAPTPAVVPGYDDHGGDDESSDDVGYDDHGGDDDGSDDVGYDDHGGDDDGSDDVGHDDHGGDDHDDD